MTDLRITPSASGQPERPRRSKTIIRPQGTLGSIVELVVLVTVAIGLALGIQAFIVKPYRIPSGSMEPTLKVGQRILADRIGMSIAGPHVGEIAVFHPPKGADQEDTEHEGEPICGATGRPVNPGRGRACSAPTPSEDTSTNFIKRVVAGPGDEIYVSEGHVYRKAAGQRRFVREHDPYIAPCEGVPECDFLTPIRIPPGHWFMMGDNRGDSDDSRFWGPVPTSWMIGQAFITYWPLDRVGTL